MVGSFRNYLKNNVKDNFFSLNLLYDIAQNEGRLYGITHNGKFLHLIY